eukprot:TRINITY_DN3322_c0_g1_i1.p1 TRINITY_DN3322_c0_g1~~TRINITY_DN3322_c0_g1_i1.p1  ORF type:complete len:175 (-),score=32.69 TRINITY_DN3322_c0_g1_i1:64-588(-)
MPGYHSKIEVENGIRIIGRIPILPVKTDVRGPAPPAQPANEDILDEVLRYFKANILFRNYEIESDADRSIVYFTLYVSQCLNAIDRKSKSAAAGILHNLAVSNFSLPGDSNFPLGGMVVAPDSRSDADVLRQYFTQCRQELGLRLIELVYVDDDRQPDKWWACFNKTKFLNMQL